MTNPVDLCLFLKDWLAWATSGDTETPSPEGVVYDDSHGLCAAVREYARSTGRDNPILNGHSSFRWFRFTSAYPFGVDNYGARRDNDTQHLDPARLEWVRNKIAELENVPEEPKPDTTLNGQPTGRDQELEDMRAINIALQAEIDDLKKYDVRQILVDTVPGLDDLNAAQVYALNAAQVAEILSSRSLENVELKGEVTAEDVCLSVGGRECQVQCGDVYEVRRADLPDHHLDPKPDETPYV